MQNSVTFETITLDPIPFDPAPFSPNPDLTDANLAAYTVLPVQRRTAAPWLRTLARKWDMVAVIALVLASGTYGLYALLFLTGY